MLWTLVRKELLTNLLTLRLAVALAFVILLSVMAAIIGSAEYSRNVDRYDEARQEYQKTLAEVTVYQQLQPQLFVPPQPLSILCRGLSEASGSRWTVMLNWILTTFGPITSGRSDMMQTLVRVDFAGVVSLLLSFLAVVLGYDGICGERERGTLQLVLSNSVPRATIVTGKLIGGFLSLWVPLALAFTVVLLILLANPDVAFAGGDWARLLLLFVLSCLFLGQIFAISLAVSAFTRSSSTSGHLLPPLARGRRRVRQRPPLAEPLRR